MCVCQCWKACVVGVGVEGEGETAAEYRMDYILSPASLSIGSDGTTTPPWSTLNQNSDQS